MIQVTQLTNNLRSYIISQLNSMASTTPIIGLIKPLVSRAIDKNFDKISKAFDLVSDKDGNIDAEGILSEMMDSIMTTKPFTINTSFIGDIEIGGGEVKLNLPLTNKRLVLNTADLNNLKEMLITKG